MPDTYRDDTGWADALLLEGVGWDEDVESFDWDGVTVPYSDLDPCFMDNEFIFFDDDAFGWMEEAGGVEVSGTCYRGLETVPVEGVSAADSDWTKAPHDVQLIGWDVIVPDESDILAVEVYTVYLAALSEEFEVDSQAISARWDGRYLEAIQFKVPVGVRDTNIVVRMKVTGSPVTLQEVVFDGASTRPSP